MKPYRKYPPDVDVTVWIRRALLVAFVCLLLYVVLVWLGLA